MKKTYTTPLSELEVVHVEKNFLASNLYAPGSLETFAEEDYEW